MNMLLSVVMLILFFQQATFANISPYPWYFDSIGITNETLSYTKRNSSVVVSVIDSGVAFVGGLSDKEYAKYSYTKDGSPYPVKDFGEAYYTHGTAMASLIASDGAVLGVFPGANISSRRVVPNPDNDSWMSAVTDANLIDLSSGIEKIINISGGQKDPNAATAWSDLLSRIGRENKKLIVAAVGNDGADIRTITPAQRIWPAAYHPTSELNKKNDPVIRVAALAEYRKGDTPVLHRGIVSGSRYGNGWVDIGAPGQNIPYLTPDNTVKVGSGTSEASAIVSGVLAAMVSCNPNATAQDLKKTLLDTADKYTSLEDEITDGRVLNANKAIKTFCMKSYVNSENNLRSRREL
ncbi:S8 family peptidase [Escherichia coli]|uniref:S8 family peptidase n=1 Tax=Escherichia coli TaxID=562 RepID=UPI002379C7D9|nr:S8/S53 family peptidase [Escherichia coli]